MSLNFVKSLGFLALVLVAVSSVAQEPSAQQTVTLYLPFDRDDFGREIENLETLLEGYPLKVQSSDYWHPYQRGVRQGSPGIFLVAPHFAAWLIHYHRFSVVSKLNQSIQYVVAVKKSDIHFFEIDDLDRGKLCTQRALNLDFLLLRSMFSRPLLSAHHQPVSDVLSEMLADESGCDGFILPNHLFKQQIEEQPNFIRLQQGEEWPAYTIVAHPDIAQSTIEGLRSLLQNSDKIKSLEPMLRRLSANPRFISANTEDYPISLADSLLFNWQKSP